MSGSTIRNALKDVGLQKIDKMPSKAKANIKSVGKENNGAGVCCSLS